MQTTQEFRDANIESDTDIQVAVYNSLSAYPASTLGDSIQARKESLRRSITERQRELEQIPGGPLSPYTNINV